MILTFEFDLDMVYRHQHAKYQSSFNLKVTVWTHTHWTQR